MFKRSFSLLAVPMAIAIVFNAAGASAATTPIHTFGFGQPVMQATFTPEETAGASYCKQTGGQVEVRTPVFGTNNSNPKSQLVLAGHAVFCQYTAKDSSRIHILVTTLNTSMPTLAALAYYAKPKMNCPGGANPSSCYCTFLGGSDQFGGTNISGGAWVLKGAVDEDLQACIFPDLSSIDSWGLAYHSANIVRGINLATVMHYKNPYKH